MTKKQTIQTLIDFNKWRRGGEGEQPYPKTVGEAIDNAITSLELQGTLYIDYEGSYRKKYNDTQALLDSALSELQFANESIEFLYNALTDNEMGQEIN